MYSETIDLASEVSLKKSNFLKDNFLGYFISSMLAGVYVGFGIILIFAVGAPFAYAENPALKLVMGASFGVALTLVVFAGSELYTGNTMYMTIGLLKKAIHLKDLIMVFFVSWLGNLVGSILLAYTAVYGGSISPSLDFFVKVATLKVNAPIFELVLRGILCNMLVCLALWISARAKSDTAKIFLIFWCLFAFKGAGFEHSVANMTLIAIAIIGKSGQISWLGYAYNLLWVTIGNTIAGGIFIGMAYYFASKKK